MALIVTLQIIIRTFTYAIKKTLFPFLFSSSSTHEILLSYAWPCSMLIFLYVIRNILRLRTINVLEFPLDKIFCFEAFLRFCFRC